ncbi:hypothetical protein KC323_g253 [Hortaea werneckii]|nr:hypothetical protein KC323_g253 [Hortaea werneckii]
MFNSHSGPVWPINLSIVVMFRVRDHTVRPRSRMSPKSTSEFSTRRASSRENDAYAWHVPVPPKHGATREKADKVRKSDVRDTVR